MLPFFLVFLRQSPSQLEKETRNGAEWWRLSICLPHNGDLGETHLVQATILPSACLPSSHYYYPPAINQPQPITHNKYKQKLSILTNIDDEDHLQQYGMEFVRNHVMREEQGISNCRRQNWSTFQYPSTACHLCELRHRSLSFIVPRKYASRAKLINISISIYCLPPLCYHSKCWDDHNINIEWKLIHNSIST